MTAGDLIRAAIADGATELGLAKRLAASESDEGPEVERWRHVVRRASRGSEPSTENVRRIAETFGASLPDLDLPTRSVSRPWREETDHRLAELEATVAEQTVSIAALREAIWTLRGLLVDEGGAMPDLPAAALPPGAEGTRS